MISQKIYPLSVFLVIIGLLFVECNAQQQPEWPEIDREKKPWTRWWWMGSAVDKENLSRQMELYRNASLGGVEITPIYGVAGYEDSFIDFLSPVWMERLMHTLEEGERLDLGIDMATGTGWPFGGPWIGEEEASRRLYYKTYRLQQGEKLEKKISYVQEPYLRSITNTIYELHGFLKADGEEPKGTAEEPLRKPGGESLTVSDLKQPLSENENLQELAIEQVRFETQLPLNALMAYSAEGEILDLTGRVDENGCLDWIPAEGEWTLYAVFSGWHGKTVERAAPGGEGFVIDHFSEKPLERYLSKFDRSFSAHSITSFRSFFNDSYEVDDAEGEANWTPDFFTEFKQRRDYDLREHLPALLDERDTETGQRVLSDYRETVSDLLLEKFTRGWDNWADDKGALIRNQAHGSPANILDLYAASDIPETEGTDILRAKMASSAANVSGKKLVSSESATWLDEHFVSSLSDVKVAIDRFFIGGINHIFYHGTAYSPSGDEWPGWLFYAAVHFNERNPFWDHFAEFNRYVTRVQSFLQWGSPDNDVLMYYPIYDEWAIPGYGLLRHFDGGLGEDLDGTPLKEGAEMMVEKGYSFDFISDRQLDEVIFSGDRLVTSGNSSYKTVVVPKSKYIPLATFQNLVKLAEEGATVIVYGGLPEGVPGMENLAERSKQFEKVRKRLEFRSAGDGDIKEASIGNGYIITGDSLIELFEHAEVRRESMVDQDLQFVRRSHESGEIYFIVNRGTQSFDGWVPLSREFASAAIFDPVREHAGYAELRTSAAGNTEIYLQLAQGESVIFKTFQSKHQKPSYPYLKLAGEPQTLDSIWSLEFIDGGPALPAALKIDSDNLKSWTEYGGNSYKNFSGTGTYSTTFEHPGGDVDGWLLDLGKVHESAGIRLNGITLGTFFGPTYKIFIPADSLRENNELVIEVSNLMANRIAAMERNNVNWKKFYNVNFPARLGTNRNERGLFDASEWEPLASGLLGPVRLIPVQLKNKNP